VSASSGPGTVTASAAVSYSPSIPVDYTVTAADGSKKTYAVTVRYAAADTDDSIEITGFYFTNPLVVGAINQNTDTITVTVPTRTYTASLTPTVYFRGFSLKPGSGSTQNFGGPVVYTVTGRNGAKRYYTVTVQLTKASTKDITSFSFPDIPNSETVIGGEPNADGAYPLIVWVPAIPAGVNLNSLTPAITHTGISINPAGGAADFTTSQPYTVTAEDGSTKTYTVSVKALGGETKVITSFVFNNVPVSGGTVRAAGSIDQDSYVITVVVPPTAAVSALAPTLTYIGNSIAGPGGNPQTANPFTDTSRNFAGSQTYTVRDQSGNGQPYTVNVIREEAVNISFEGEIDRKVIASNSFDQSTGILTITLNNDPGTGITPPYEWYIDGVKQAVSSTETIFTVNAGDGSFIPGRHEITVSGLRGGLHYTGHVYFVVSK
jgi:hypothetical protein